LTIPNELLKDPNETLLDSNQDNVTEEKVLKKL
jgi:hypothetical protein